MLKKNLALINARPKKVLHFRTPQGLFQEISQGAALSLAMHPDVDAGAEASVRPAARGDVRAKKSFGNFSFPSCNRRKTVI